MCCTANHTVHSFSRRFNAINLGFYCRVVHKKYAIKLYISMASSYIDQLSMGMITNVYTQSSYNHRLRINKKKKKKEKEKGQEEQNFIVLF